MKKLFLLDAFALIYRAYYAFIKTPRVNSKGMNTSAVLGFVNTLQEVLTKEKPTHIAVCFDPVGGTFRHKAFEAYKAQREAQPEDITLAVPYVKRILEAYRIPIIEVPGYEADDVIGTLARMADEREDFITFMMTPDKDYAQLVSERTFMYRPKSFGPGFDVMGIPEVLAKYDLKRVGQVIDLLGLMGDASDNIPGCPGVGLKTAQKLIAEFDSIEGLLEHTASLKGALQKKVTENEQQIRDSKYLATICRDVPVEFDEAAMVYKEPDYSALQAVFDELEFRQLAAKVIGNRVAGGAGSGGSDMTAGTVSTASPTEANARAGRRKAAAVKKSDGMGSLFDEAEEAGAGMEKGVSGRDGDAVAGIGAWDMQPSAATVGAEAGAPASLLPGIESVETHYVLCDTPEKRADMIQQLFFCECWAFDTETTSLDVMAAELVGISFAVGGHRAWYVPVPAGPEAARAVVEELRPLFENEGVEKIAQNVKYDYSILRRYGVEVCGPLFDTMIAHYLMQPEMRHGMDYLSEVYLQYRPIPTAALLGEDAKKKAKKGEDLLTMRDLPVGEVMRYCCEDSDVTFRLAEIFRAELKKQKLTQLFYDIEMPLVTVLADMELAGVRLDTAALKETESILNAELKNIEAQLTEWAGHPFNPLSPKMVGEVLFDEMKLDAKAKKTRTGQYVTSEEVLQKLKDRSPIVEGILNYRGVKKLLSTYVEALPAMVNPATGRIHTSFNQTVTATGRLSSSNPNLQNIPIRDEMGRELRKAFIPDEGCLFFSADYSQIELRIMAHLSEDPAMTEAFFSGEDIHAATAAKIYHLPIAGVSKLQRTKAKTANFGIIYGISVFGLASRLNIPRSEAKELIDGYFATYPKVREYMDRSIEMAREKGYVETIFGRKRMLPDIHSHNATVRGYAERNAINAPIQGSAADIIKIAMVRIARRIKREHLRAKLLIQVHDELNFSVPVEELERLKQLVLEEMAGACSMRVPLIADCGSGSNWMEAH